MIIGSPLARRSGRGAGGEGTLELIVKAIGYWLAEHTWVGLLGN